jgi:CRISPR-associated protein Csx10
MTDRYYYFATLVDGVSLSASHSSDYAQVCLDYIAGSAVSGALASSLYRKNTLDTNILNRVFQNNEAVFSNCLPLQECQPADKNGGENLHVVLPAPSCLHYEKGTQEGESDFLNPAIQDPGKTQLKQVRSGYLDSTAQKFSVTRNAITRTAIDPLTQGAKDGQLFTLNFINAGAVFWGYIDIPENTIPRNVMEDFLQSEVRIGKSRSSEFGRVKFSLMDEKSQKSVAGILETPASRDGELYLWCLSDAEFINTETAQSTWEPQFSNLWLPGLSKDDGTFDPEKSFIRTGRIRLFNRKRNGHDSEKMVIKRGSIIRFTLKKPLDTKQLQELSQRGIGLSRHQGLGRVLVNPAFLSEERIKPGSDNALFPDLPLTLLKAAPDKTCLQDYDYLVKFAERCKSQGDEFLKYDDEGQAIMKGIVSIYTASRAYSNSFDTDQYGQTVTDPGRYGPSLSQWSVIRDMVIRCSDASGVMLDDSSAIFKKISAKLRDENQREAARTGWDTHFTFAGKTNTTFAAEFEGLIKNKPLGALRKALEALKNYDMSKLVGLREDTGEFLDRTGRNDK